MFMNSEDYYQSITKTLLEEKTWLNDLKDNDLELHKEIFTVARGRIDVGYFGPGAYQKPAHAA